MIFRRTFLAVVTCSALMALAPLASASSSASEFVREKHSKLVDLVKAGKPDAEVDKVFSQVLDYSVLAEASLGNHWAERSEAERKEFTELLAKLVRISYRKNIRKTLGYTVEYKGTDKGEGGDIVHTVASSTNAREEPLSIDYVVRDLGQGPRIVDVVTEGSSMVNNYRSSFNRIMKKGGFQDVLKRMRAKVAGGGAGGVD